MKRQKVTGKVIYSPSDLMIFAKSPFASWMERSSLDDPALLEMRDEDDPLMTILAKRGDEHEASHLESLQESGRSVIAFEGWSTVEQTLKAIDERPEIIYQAKLTGSGFEGYADFLKLGARGYEVWDTKLSKRVKPEYLLQLCAYADMFHQMTGTLPVTIGLVLGSGKEKSFHVAEYFDYYEHVRDAFLSLMDSYTRGEERPVPDIAWDHGRWSGVASAYWEQADGLNRIAGITRKQIETLEGADITTVAALVDGEVDAVPGMHPKTFRKLKRQAALQQETQKQRVTEPGSPPAWEYLDSSELRAGLGFSVLPESVPEGDIFFDIEGYPMSDGRLEYLLGATYIENGEQKFRAFWAHDFAAERESFREFMIWVLARWRAHSDMHIYHYAHYENAALKALASRHDTMIEEVDELLRGNVLVDLYSVVRNALRVGEANYSLKSVEHLYLGKRTGEVSSGGDSIIQYDRFRELSLVDDSESREAAERIIQFIEDYNKVDCDSTLYLAQWLWSNRPEKAPNSGENYAEEHAEKDRALSDKAQRRATLRDLSRRLREMPPDDTVAQVLADVVNYHEREEKPLWWRYFELRSLNADELRDAPEVITDARFQSMKPGEGRSRSSFLTFDFPVEQSIEIKEGSGVEVLGWENDDGFSAKGEICSLDDVAGTVEVRITNKQITERVSVDALDTVSLLVKPNVIDKARFEVRLIDLATRKSGGEAVPACLRHFLERQLPPVSNLTPGVVASQGVDPARIAELIANESDFSLCVQGPPGTGKTHSLSRVVGGLLRGGKRVAVICGSHAVARNFVSAVGEAMPDRRDDEMLFCQVKQGDDTLEADAPCAEPLVSWDECPPDARFVAGTHFFFAREDADHSFDYLFIDEAGQFALADLVALSTVAKSLVLIGDPQQLPQVVQGSHPGVGAMSCLEYTLNGQDILGNDQGLFLPVTYRLSPGICEFVSETSYESHLRPAESTGQRALIADSDTPFSSLSGIRFLPIWHVGNSQDSAEEAEAIAETTRKLLEVRFRDVDGTERNLTIDDFLFVSPYNLQVARLRRTLPAGAKVGSVNLFQGQQALVVFVSLCASPDEFGPRGSAFVLDRNRMNVAVSRAKCLAIVVGNPEILNSSVNSVEDIRRFSTLARLVRRHGDSTGVCYRGEGVAAVS